MSGAANPAPMDTPQVLLEHHLKMLRLPTFLREYDKMARQCSDESVDYPRYLLRMTELELLDRERRATERRIHQARFPVVKSLDTFEFLSIPSVNKALVLELARCEFLQRRENVLLLGNSGTEQNASGAGTWSGRLPEGLSRTLHDSRGNGPRTDGGTGREAATALPETDGQLRTADRR